MVRQRGSHVRLFHPEKLPITVPTYPTIDRSLLKKILREAEMTPEEFIGLL
jgi:predicted RNA binding protein YcfA (HicA-like mRNA interferase family)